VNGRVRCRCGQLNNRFRTVSIIGLLPFTSIVATDPGLPESRFTL
jgi:hypothetical protein